MGSTSQFEFFKSDHVPSLTVLKAAIGDFSYDRHAHEEYALGVTLAGRQDFFSGGQFHRSPPGNVILFNPEDVHDGHSGGEQALDYLMVYVHPDQVAPLFEDALGRPLASPFRSQSTLIQDSRLRQAILNVARMVTHQVGSCIDQENALSHVVERMVQLGGNMASSPVARRPDALLNHAKAYIHEHLAVCRT